MWTYRVVYTHFQFEKLLSAHVAVLKVQMEAIQHAEMCSSLQMAP